MMHHPENNEFDDVSSTLTCQRDSFRSFIHYYLRFFFSVFSVRKFLIVRKSKTMSPNGTRFGGWLLNTFDNRIWAAADFDGDRRAELLITSPWGIGVLAWTGAAINSLMLKPNGTRFGGWQLNTADNPFRSFQDITGLGRANILVESPWGLGIMHLNGASFQVPAMYPNGTRLGSWLLNTHDNLF